MSDDPFPQHYVCTHQQARELVEQHQQFWLGTCGCREGGAGCKRSGTEVCLTFLAGAQVSHPHRYRATREQVEQVLRMAESQHLVSRPFRDMQNKQVVEGICHCCDDCCSYFLNPGEPCDKGSLIEHTDPDACTNCGDCIDVCYFGARMMAAKVLELHQEVCYGCGLCQEFCPVEAITLIPRAANITVKHSA